ncbi:hypothetical protein OG689_26345 [Kitasatospora sp. NBC_00240]|uniref:hypothetical protein n=1 Tax=Kitasatospora sp. NBC_00240 TaxID=2903567 RepID=UPI00225338D9|nr:hypothetical protein [Kitasatospora sp. NBC_00240]MCX5212760.1 hypothetical protein [Kitasatospora sp. NBC_00240]
MSYPPEYTPGSSEPRLNRPVPERYPQIRATSGYADPRVRRTGPGPGAGTEQEPERSAMLTARLAVACTVVIGQLWALTVATNAWMAGRTATAWWCTGFSAASFLVVLLAWWIGPRDR